MSSKIKTNKKTQYIQVYDSQRLCTSTLWCKLRLRVQIQHNLEDFKRFPAFQKLLPSPEDSRLFIDNYIGIFFLLSNPCLLVEMVKTI